MSINFNYTTNPTLGANALGKVYSNNSYYSTSSTTQVGWNYAVFLALPAGTYLYTLSGYLCFNIQLTNVFLITSELLLDTVTTTTIGGSTPTTSNAYTTLNTTYGISGSNVPTNTPYPGYTCFPLNQSMVLTVPNTTTTTSGTTTTTITYNYLSYMTLYNYTSGQSSALGTTTYVGVIQMTRIA